MAANLVRGFQESSPPVGFTHATGQVTAALPTPNDIRTGSFTSDGWSSSGQRRNSYAQKNGLSRSGTNATVQQPGLPTINQEVTPDNNNTSNAGQSIGGLKESNIAEQRVAPNRTASGTPLDQLDPDSIDPMDITAAPAPVAHHHVPHDPLQPYPNGYQFPPKHSFWKSTQIGLRAFGKFVLTPVGFLITIYGLNVVAWGGMLFLILCNASPAMCHPSCTDNDSGGKVWLEIDSQILNALFCVTGLGLIPWRFRDLYYLMQYRLQKKEVGIRRLAGIHNDWFRLNGSDDVPYDFNPKDAVGVPPGVSESTLAYPVSNNAVPPLTGERAAPTKYWKMDFFVWAFVINTLLQIFLCGVMWGLNRFNRPGWTTGLLISLACIIAMAGGWMSFKEGKAVKKVEGVPVSIEDLEILHHMQDAEKTGVFATKETPDVVA